MFEEYLEDADFFLEQARRAQEEREAKRYFRASVFCAASALEAFVNYVGDAFEQGNAMQPHEIAFVTDGRFGYHQGQIVMQQNPEYHRLEDKLRLLLVKFVPTFDFTSERMWSQCLQFKRFRDSVVHPRDDEDSTSCTEYDQQISKGLSAEIELMSTLCQGMFKRPLRKKLLDLISW